MVHLLKDQLELLRCMGFSGPMLTPGSCKKVCDDDLNLGSVCCMQDSDGMMACSILKKMGAGLGP